jgi:hypothetical protein
MNDFHDSISIVIHFCSMKQFREETVNADAQLKLAELNSGPKASYGYGGKFGVEKDRCVAVIYLFFFTDFQNCYVIM